MSAVTGKAISVQPAQHTKYIVQYENNCILSDTIIIEVYPLAVSADWSEFEKTECEGQTLTATLTLSGYDAGVSGSYIRWYREKGGNEEELTLHAGQSSLVIQSSSEEESGNYRYEVSNGVCVMPQNPDIQPLEVKPAVRFTLPQTEYTVIRGEGVTLQATGIQPEDAVITWTDGVITHTANPAEISGITRDQIWTVKAGGENYCETSAEVSIRVDARITVDIALKDNTDRICRGTGITLSADTSGTGDNIGKSIFVPFW